MRGARIQKVLVQTGVAHKPVVKEILARLPNRTPVEQFEGKAVSAGSEQPDLQKQTLYLLSHKGRFLKDCPGAKAYFCCGYKILNVGTNCPLNCSYCILQAYFNQPGLRAYTNLAEQIEQVLEEIDRHPRRTYRIGTGEFTDSLAMDDFLHWSDRLVPLLAKRKNAVLELKTKTDRIERLLRLKQRDRIIVAWSLNSPYIAGHEEHGAAGLRKRLEAARKCQAEGFALAFHFDPLILHPDWKAEYLKTIDLLDRYIKPEGIIWLSLGSFRFMPALKPIIRRRHPGSCVLDGEFITALDGKMRYFKPQRIELYAFMRENLANWYADTGLYLCMEGDEVWRKALGWSPGDSSGLSRYLDSRVTTVFG